jgi:methionyl-tRNA formyltransferase
MVSLRVVFFGTPAFAVPTLRELLASRHPVVGVVTQPDRARGRGQKVTFAPVKTLARERGVPIIQPEKLRDPLVIDTLGQWRPDLGVVAAYGKLIPENLLTIPRLGMINVHGSLLPRWRGAAPVHRAVIAGDHETGITIMRVVKSLDAGAMFAKVTRAIDPDETSEAVEQDLAELGARLLVDVVDDMADGRAIEEPQDESLVTYAAKITKDEGLIDWSQTAAAIHNRVRGLHPWPHASTLLNAERLILLRTSIVDGRPHESAGTVVEVTRDAIVVAAGQGRVAIHELQAEGRRPMTTRDFLAGRQVPVGTRLGA